jgi:hypothetical protein
MLFNSRPPLSRTFVIGFPQCIDIFQESRLLSPTISGSPADDSPCREIGRQVQYLFGLSLDWVALLLGRR